MTSRAEEIQRLIADIENLLAKSGKRLPRVLPGQAPEPKQVLERIRDFLIKLADEALESDSENKLSQQSQLSPLLTKFVDQGNNQSSPEQDQPDQQQSTVIIPPQQKIDFSALLQPLQAELQTLLQERANLVQEIRQLERIRLHNYSLTQQMANQEQMISEFLQVLMSRLVPTLTPQTADNLANSLNVASSSTEPASTSTQHELEPTDQVERLTRFAAELDRRLLSLDGTVNVIFEALQRNIHTYHESLSQALARMHSQGVLGEHLMVSFVNNLTSLLQQQPLNPQQSFLGRENETPSPSSVSRADNITQFAPQSFEFTHPAASSSPTIIQLETGDKREDTAAIAVDEPSSGTATPVNPVASQPNSSELVGDEVDQLYASLFATDNFTYQSRQVAPKVVTGETDVTDNLSATAPASPPKSNIIATDGTTNQVQPLVAENEVTAKVIRETNVTDDVSAFTTDSSSESVTNEVQQLVPFVLSDPLFEETKAGLVDASNPHPQATPDTIAEELSESQETFFHEENTEVVASEVIAAPGCVEEPASADTITVLSDLLVNVAANTSEAATNVTVEAQMSEVVTNDEDLERSPQYISASPQENLLPQAEAIAESVFDISLDEDQLQQLNQDLASFDQQLNSQSQLEITKENQPTAENTSSVESVLEISPASVDQPDVEIVKKSEPTTASSDFINHTEVGFNLVDSVWYLGIDLGTTGISAALLNRSTNVVYPLYWSAQNQPAATSLKPSFRLPAEVYLPAPSVSHSETQSVEALLQTAPASVASEKVPDNLASSMSANSAFTETSTLYSAQLKPYLQIAVPYKSEQQKWEPVLQLNDFSAGPLIWVVRSLSKLLLTLKCDRTSTTPGLTAAAVGIDEQSFCTIINNIVGVICTCPSNCSEQYRFNVREALLISKLIEHPQQVFFVEEAIASLLSELDGANGETVQFSVPQGSGPPIQSDRRPIGSTLVINIGATTTEMALVDLPENLQELKHSDFMLHGFAYAGKGIEQDIICQLLFPQKWRQSRSGTQSDRKTISSNSWHWQPAIAGLDQMRLSSLGLEELELPRPGELDITARIRLQQRLESSLLGQAVLDAGLALKLILQHQESFTLELADQRWMLQRRDLEAQVFVPFVRRLNRELNRLLVAKGIPTEAINQAILTGGVASLGAVNRWLRQKLPNAKIIQDLLQRENVAPTCSRVAYGLAMLPLHPQVLEVPKQQYTDYFLFSELLRLMPVRSLSFSEVIQLFENRGINTRSCQQRLLAFLEGELPPGLIPNSVDSTWLTQTSLENSEYKAIAAEALFDKQGSLTYRPNFQQLQSVRHYLDAIKASTQQSLEEPYTVNFVMTTISN